jgi:hypothetical protein
MVFSKSKTRANVCCALTRPRGQNSGKPSGSSHFPPRRRAIPCAWQEIVYKTKSFCCREILPGAGKNCFVAGKFSQRLGRIVLLRGDSPRRWEELCCCWGNCFTPGKICFVAGRIVLRRRRIVLLLGESRRGWKNCLCQIESGEAETNCSAPPGTPPVGLVQTIPMPEDTRIGSPFPSNPSRSISPPISRRNVGGGVRLDWLAG